MPSRLRTSLRPSVLCPTTTTTTTTRTTRRPRTTRTPRRPRTSWTTRTTRTKRTTRTTRTTSPTTTTTTTTTMPSSLRHPVCPNLPSPMLPTEEALNQCFWTWNWTGLDDIRMTFGLLEAISIISWIWLVDSFIPNAASAQVSRDLLKRHSCNWSCQNYRFTSILNDWKILIS